MTGTASHPPSLPPAPNVSGPEKEISLSPTAFHRLAEQLRRKRGLNLFGYKERYARRRLAVRLRARKCRTLENYLALLSREPEEWDQLSAALSINVSSFYRNPETFELIRTRLMPELIQWRKRQSEPRLRLWSAGCAEGEEAYSLAIMLREYFPGALATMSVSILGTDIDEDSLARAAAGVYPESRLAELPPALAEKYFTRRGQEWVLRRRLKGLVRFHRHDLLADPAPADLDLVVCRNVLIYLSREEQERILDRFAEGLRPGGYLVLGKTETLLGRRRRDFTPLFPQERIYQKPEPAPGPDRQEVEG